LRYQSVHEHHIDGTALPRQRPLVGLIGPGRISGAESFAGPMQAYRRATLVGERTAGLCGVVRTVDRAPGGSICLATHHTNLGPEESRLNRIGGHARCAGEADTGGRGGPRSAIGNDRNPADECRCPGAGPDGRERRDRELCSHSTVVSSAAEMRCKSLLRESVYDSRSRAPLPADGNRSARVLIRLRVGLVGRGFRRVSGQCPEGLDHRVNRLQKSSETLRSKALVILTVAASPVQSSALSVRSEW
jgi:hypothetical protein